MPRLGVKELLNAMIPVPPLNAQKRIAAVLDKICELKKNAETRLEKLDTLVKSRFVAMFGDAREENIRFPALQGKELFSFASGKFLSPDLRKDQGVPVYGGNGISWYTNKPFVESPTIVIGRVGAYCGNVHYISSPAWITDNAIYIKEFKKKVFDLRFLSLYMTFLDFSRFAAKSGQPKITQRPLDDIQYILPPLAHQREFAAFVEKVDKLRETARWTVEAMDTLYRSKLQEYFG